MGICPLTNGMCLFCSHGMANTVCMQGDQIRNIKDLRMCPQTVVILPKTDERTANQPS